MSLDVLWKQPAPPVCKLNLSIDTILRPSLRTAVCVPAELSPEPSTFELTNILLSLPPEANTTGSLCLHALQTLLTSLGSLASNEEQAQVPARPQRWPPWQEGSCLGSGRITLHRHLVPASVSPSFSSLPVFSLLMRRTWLTHVLLQCCKAAC